MPLERLTDDMGLDAGDGKAPPDVDHASGRERMLTTAQVAEQLQLSVPLVRKAIRDGRLEASLPAGRKHGYRVAPSAVARWLLESRAGPGGLS